MHDLGEKVGSTFWARGVLAVSNDIRHHQEWDFPDHEPIEIQGKKYFKKINRTLDDIVDLPRFTIEPLVNLGLSIDEVVKSNSDITFKIVDKLELGNKDLTLARIHQWIESLLLRSLKQLINTY